MIVAIITHGDDDHDESQHLADAVELLLQRRRLFGHVLQHPGDAPHFGLHPGRHNHRTPPTVGRRRAAEHHVVAVAESHAAPRSASVSFETGRLSPVSAASAVCSAVDWINPRVGGNGVAFLDEDDVAGYDFGRAECCAARRRASRARARPTSGATRPPRTRPVTPGRSP